MPDDYERLRIGPPDDMGMPSPKKKKKNALEIHLATVNSPEKKMQESMTRKMNIGRVMKGGTMPKRMVMTQHHGMMSEGESIKLGHQKKSDERESARKSRMEKPKDEATEYYKQLAREQRKKRGMDS